MIFVKGDERVEMSAGLWWLAFCLPATPPPPGLVGGGRGGGGEGGGGGGEGGGGEGGGSGGDLSIKFRRP